MAGNANSGNKTMTNPYKAKSADAVDPEENHNNIGYLRELSALPKCDLTDPDAIDRRTDEFLEMCDRYNKKPLIVPYSMALGIDRSTLFRLCEGYENVVHGVTDSCIERLKKGRTLIEANLETLLVDQRSGQPGLIFSLKQFGWRDQVEVAAAGQTKQTPRLSGETPEDIARRYAELVGVDADRYEVLPAEPPADSYELPKA